MSKIISKMSESQTKAGNQEYFASFASLQNLQNFQNLQTCKTCKLANSQVLQTCKTCKLILGTCGKFKYLNRKHSEFLVGNLNAKCKIKMQNAKCKCKCKYLKFSPQPKILPKPKMFTQT